eukprot:CAMPEP_0182419482 /NCGR_PEP_ID=MMETSP1167-20130531/3935_1 /TAXON_ID=2988 /ORGANISM="Mallomonas Sp, Strain CCMP3275" /LENGTH=145 /DNA_ID=CAMNT_0024594437 /DNA_START=189 /DNA_END=626 /DNA_ORIENTATION=-
MLGKKFFEWSGGWTKIRKILLERPSPIGIESITYFLNKFEESFVSSPSDSSTSPCFSLSAIVWTNDFNAVLAKRRDIRNKEVSHRSTDPNAMRPDAFTDLSVAVTPLLRSSVEESETSERAQEIETSQVIKGENAKNVKLYEEER